MNNMKDVAIVVISRTIVNFPMLFFTYLFIVFLLQKEQ